MGCSEPSCTFAGSPPTGRNKIEEILSNGTACPVTGCIGIQTHIRCLAHCRIDEDHTDPEAVWGLLRHQGKHTHEWPEAKKADPLSKAKLKDVVLNDPKVGPLGLKVGQAHVGTDPIKSIVEVHSSFGNTDRLGYLRRLILIEHGLMADKNDKEGGDKWLIQLMHWCRLAIRVSLDGSQGLPLQLSDRMDG
ncbi:uncharacterized protein MELLADRAFT_90561 [Melampsora larici-populina 98AG31]|uniref:Uncharacterized protein n=1 Tax=Melampsora larici-populina (strain 98AG31 / pathotype 3-4-7) TaxID=747676 RepID=F4RXC9_MELLP|nr:uncharacterized protein MELLADRAFT_90561 [Melampsora larici-populina 98AG31]EGG02943.1 hypothetical protein MELLADRAFT_90561 [Melampsora larici-populina 98AG31]